MVDSTYQIFVDLDATALEGGYVWVGAEYDNPEVRPIPVFWDAEHTIVALQPLRTSGGYIVRDGTPADVFTAANTYSIVVNNSRQQRVFYTAIAGGGVAASRVAFPIPSGPVGADGPSGPTGPANSTYATLAAMKAADASKLSYILATATGPVTYSYVAGDYTGKADDINVVKLDGVALTVGALVKGKESFKTPSPVPYLRLISDKLYNDIDLMDFGAYAQPANAGNVAWDTNAFKRAYDHMQNFRRAVPVDPTGVDIGLAYPGPALPVPPGDYKVSGVLAQGLTRLAMSCAPKTATITQMDGGYLFETGEVLTDLYLSGFYFIGGEGVLRHTRTERNVQQSMRVEDCLFVNYTGTAIVSESLDMPYWYIARNQFLSAIGAGNRKGVAIGGLMDGTIIANNAFLRNDYHLQIGPIESGSFHILENDFLSFEGDRTLADLVLVPNATVGGFKDSSGNGSRVWANKFGNEGINSYSKKSPRILIAALTAGTRAAATPDMTWKDGSNGANYLSGISFRSNRFQTASPGGNDGPDASLMKLYCEKVDKLTWGEDNSFDGGAFNYLFEHEGPRISDKANTNWNVSLPNTGPSVRNAVTNFPVGIVTDVSGTDPGPFNLGRQNVDPTAGRIKLANAPSSWVAAGGATVAAVANLDGAVDATEVTFANANSTIAIDLGNVSAFMDRTGWIVGVYKVLPGGVTRVRMRLEVSNPAGTFLIDRVVPLAATGRFETMSVSFPWPAYPIFATLSFSPIGADANDKLVLGDFAVGYGKVAPSLA